MSRLFALSAMFALLIPATAFAQDINDGPPETFTITTGSDATLLLDTRNGASWLLSDVNGSKKWVVIGASIQQSVAENPPSRNGGASGLQERYSDLLEERILLEDRLKQAALKVERIRGVIGDREKEITRMVAEHKETKALLDGAMAQNDELKLKLDEFIRKSHEDKKSDVEEKVDAVDKEAVGSVPEQPNEVEQLNIKLKQQEEYAKHVTRQKDQVVKKLRESYNEQGQLKKELARAKERNKELVIIIADINTKNADLKKFAAESDLLNEKLAIQLEEAQDALSARDEEAQADVIDASENK